MTTAEMPQAASTPTGQDDTLLEVRGLKMYFPVTSGILFQRAVAYIKAVTTSASPCAGARRWAWWRIRLR